MHAREEVYTDQAINDIKMEMTIRKVFAMYRNCKSILLDSVVDQMLASGGYDPQPRAPGMVDKLSKYSVRYLDAERYVEFIDSLLKSLDDLSHKIIYLCYCDPTQPTNREIYQDIYQDYKISERQYYRDKKKARRKIYALLVKNYDKIKKWQ